MQTYETFKRKAKSSIIMSWYQLEVEADKYDELQELFKELEYSK